MSFTREQMDALVEDHFRFEAMDDVDGVLGTLLDGAVHEVIPSPVGALVDPAEQRAYYELLFDSIRGERVEPCAAPTATTSWSTSRSGTGGSKTAGRSSATVDAAK